MELQTDDFLESRDVDAVMALVLNLATEVIDLQERVHALETGRARSDEGLQARIDALVSRIGRPLDASRNLL